MSGSPHRPSIANLALVSRGALVAGTPLQRCNGDHYDEYDDRSPNSSCSSSSDCSTPSRKNSRNSSPSRLPDGCSFGGVGTPRTASVELGEDSDELGAIHSEVGGQRRCRRLVLQFFEQDHEAPMLVQRLAFCYQLTAAILVISLFVVDSTTAPTVTTTAYWYTELIVTIVWTMEFFLRLWSSPEKFAPGGDCKQRCRARFEYMVASVMLLDLLSLVSLVIDLSIESNNYRGIAALRMMRLLTLFRIERDFKIFGPVLMVLREKRGQLMATLGIAVLVLCVASVIMFYVEAPTNPDFNSVLLSMWWCTTALTTVGYGDIVPRSGVGRFVACIVAFIGTGMFGLFAGILAEGFRESFKKDRRFRKGLKTAPPKLSDNHGDMIAWLDERLRDNEDRITHRFEKLEREMLCLRTEVRTLLDRNSRKNFRSPGSGFSSARSMLGGMRDRASTGSAAAILPSFATIV